MRMLVVVGGTTVHFVYISNLQVYGSLQPRSSKLVSKNISLEGSGEDVFVWQHSVSKVFEPALPYDPVGVFLNFQQYNVESRDRVKCVSAKDGQFPLRYTFYLFIF